MMFNFQKFLEARLCFASADGVLYFTSINPKEQLGFLWGQAGPWGPPFTNRPETPKRHHSIFKLVIKGDGVNITTRTDPCIINKEETAWVTWGNNIRLTSAWTMKDVIQELKNKKYPELYLPQEYHRACRLRLLRAGRYDTIG